MQLPKVGLVLSQVIWDGINLSLTKEQGKWCQDLSFQGHQILYAGASSSKVNLNVARPKTLMNGTITNLPST